MIIDRKLYSKNIYFRSLTMEDCTQKYVDWLNDKDINKFLETRFTVQTLPLIREFVKSTNDSKDNWMFGIFAVDAENGDTEYNADKKSATEMHIGNIKVGPVHPVYKSADISYFIGDKTYWGTGAAEEAVRLISKFAFEDLGLNRIQGGCFGKNILAHKILLKCGFQKEAVFRKKLLTGGLNDPNGKWDDHIFYGILKSDYFGEKN